MKLSRSMFAMAIFVGVGMSALSVGAVDMPADMPMLTYEQLLRKRPTDFYRLKLNQAPDLCVSLLHSLNEARLWDGPPRAVEHALLDNGYVLHEWGEKRFQVGMTNAAGERYVYPQEQMLIDIDNDGSKEAVYRDSGSRGIEEFDHVTVSKAPDPDELSDEVLTWERWQEIAGPQEYIVRLHALFIDSRTTWPHDEAYFTGNGDAYFVEIVSMQGQNYFLVAKSIFWNLPVKVSLLRYRSSRDFQTLCRFSSAAIIVNGG